MKSVKVDINTKGKVSRLEVLIRIIYGLILWIVYFVFAIIAGILWFINILTCLILAKRVAPEFQAAVLKQHTYIIAYLMLLTDERPPIIPEFK